MPAAADVAGSPQPGTTTRADVHARPRRLHGRRGHGQTYTRVVRGRLLGDRSDHARRRPGGDLHDHEQRQAAGASRKNVNLEPEGGTVKIKEPGSKRFRVLKEGEQVPVGTIVDTRKGRVTLIAAASKTTTATAQFFDGLFKIGQTKGKKPTTVLTLTEKLTGCKATGKASAAAKKKKKRRLWGDGKGRFTTKGKHSAATVVGTKWLVEDRCTSTLTKVARGRVKVRDFVKHKTVFVKKGHRYIARAK